MGEKDTCCFTGHRPSKLPWGTREEDPRCVDLKGRIAAALEEEYAAGVRHFISGMARGADLYFAEAVLALKERCPDVLLECARPVSYTHLDVYKRQAGFRPAGRVTLPMAARRRKVHSTPFPPNGENCVCSLAPPLPGEPVSLGFAGSNEGLDKAPPGTRPTGTLCP